MSIYHPFVALISLMCLHLNATAQCLSQKDSINEMYQRNVPKIDTFDKYNNQHLNLYAADFRFICSDDNDTLSLYDLKCDSLIILFYDPDCSHCKREIKKLRKNKHLNSLINTKQLTVMSIPPDIGTDEWLTTVKHMPKQWINAYSPDNDIIIRKYLWKVPEMFILDRHKRIVHINMYKEDYDE